MVQRPLSFHQLSAMEIGPVELVKVAGAAGFQRACVFVCETGAEGALPFPLVSRSNFGEMRAALADTGIEIWNLELFYLMPQTRVEDFRPFLEIGAELGGKRATAFGVDPDDNRMTENFAKFCELTAEFDIQAGLEFMAFTLVKNFAHAMRIIRGANHPNGTLALDPLHLMRNGSSPDDLRKIGPDMIGYVQFCDGPATMPEDQWFEEAVHNRMAPGEGAFPLHDIVRCLKPGAGLSLEAPMERRRQAGMDALARAKFLYKATRDLLKTVDT